MQINSLRIAMGVFLVATSATPFTLSPTINKRDATPTPSTVLPNGAQNPFYPCGADQASIDACPFRCYDTAIPDLPNLIDSCFTASQASDAIAQNNSVCVACVLPRPEEIPSNATSQNKCQPVQTYFNASSISSPPPSQCGTPDNPVHGCDWSCAEEQVPFDSCASQNVTSTTKYCKPCLMQCSSPRLVFDPPKMPTSFSLTSGNCSSNPVEKTACPYRCTDGGDEYNAYCSFMNRNITGGFTTCKAC